MIDSKLSRNLFFSRRKSEYQYILAKKTTFPPPKGGAVGAPKTTPLHRLLRCSSFLFLFFLTNHHPLAHLYQFDLCIPNTNLIKGLFSSSRSSACLEKNKGIVISNMAETLGSVLDACTILGRSNDSFLRPERKVICCRGGSAKLE